ncbi:hypothetical protein EOD42_07535 [Rhodovarius crocodyli]|uniref:Uncharacterized protein n=1 Tax=Rhodovarius crocodyli TaxID=1979269 RepID=A0A437MJ28_9PROT|nr:hypothetical protein [Rhodovarius crocodyli]RVT97660.1 hypothetical protein EOD42_07535 [Rhodovarius crocodyli]
MIPEFPLLDFTKIPPRVDRRAGAALLTQYMFPISKRTLEAWPLTWRRVNGKAVVETKELFALAQQKLDAAPAIRNGKNINP